MKYTYQKNQLTEWKDGYFTGTGNKQWEEFQANDLKFVFIEKKRDQDFIYLFDNVRDFWLKLPKEGGMAFYRWDNDRNWIQLYNVRKESDQVSYDMIPTPDVLPFDDNVVINNTPILKAARLVNIPTNTASLKQAHNNWILNELIPAIRQIPNPWIDLYGYASKKGKKEHNLKLSRARTEAVKKFIGDNLGSLNKSIDEIVNINVGFGEDDPGNLNREPEEDDSGYWRAVEIRAFGSKPNIPNVPPLGRREPKKTYEKFMIRLMLGGQVPGIPAFTPEAYRFQIVDLDRNRSANFLFIALGVDIPLVGLDDIIKLFVPTISVNLMPGPWKEFSTDRPSKLYHFNSPAACYHDPGAQLIKGFGGTYHLNIKRIGIDSFAFTSPRPIPIESGVGIASPSAPMPAEGLLIMETAATEFLGY